MVAADGPEVETKETRGLRPKSVGVGGPISPVKRGANVVVLDFQPVERRRLVGTIDAAYGALHEIATPLKMAISQTRGLLARFEHLLAKLTDRLEHPKAWLTSRPADPSHEVPGDEPLHQVKGVVRRSPFNGSVENKGRGLQREAADEDRERSEGPLLIGIEQVVAPGDRVAEGALAIWKVTRAAGQQ